MASLQLGPLPRPPRHRAPRARFLAWALAAATAVGGAACHDDDGAGVRVEIEVADEIYRPQYLKFHWLRPGREPFEERLPEQGQLEAGARPVASVYVETVGPLREPRGLVMRGFRDGKEVSGGVLKIPPSQTLQRLFRLELREVLPDLDRNGVPDVVDMNCFDADGPAACPNGPIDNHDAGGTGPTTMDAGGGSDDGAPDAAPPIIEQDLVGFWRFDDGAGSTMALDSSGHGNHGSLRGAGTSWVSGRSGGGALEIPNQMNHGVLVPASPSIDGVHTFTIAAWIYRVDQRSGLANVLSRRSSGVYEHYALAIGNDGEARVYLNSQDSPSDLPLTSDNEIPIDAWTHLCATYDGKRLRLYINGAEAASVATSEGIDANTTPLCLGCGQNSDNGVVEPATGRLDDVRLYSRALSAAEVAAIAR